MSTATHIAEGVLCHCLRVHASDLSAAAATGAVNSLKDAMDVTGAGSGCTACHCAIRELLGDCPESWAPPDSP